MGLIKSAPDVRPGDDRRRRSRDVQGLVAALGQEDPEVRRRAVLDLTGDPSAIPALLVRYQVEADTAVAESLRTALVASDDLVVARFFSAQLGLDDAALRNSAVLALQLMPKATEELVGELLADPDPRVRTAAVGLATGGTPAAALDRWVSVVAQDQDQNVVAAAVEAAVGSGTECGALIAEAVRRFPGNPYFDFLAATFACAP